MKKRKGSFLSNKLVSLTEYVFIFAKNSSIQLFGGKPDNSESQPIIKRTNSKKTLHFKANLVKTKLPNGIYSAGVYGESTTASELLNDIEIKDGFIITEFDICAPFVWGQDFLEEEIQKGTEIFINTKNFQVRVIRHNNESIKALPSFIDGRDCNATNEDAYELLKEIFSEERPFQYSKPVNLIKHLILSNSYFNKDAVILDFFAGSGTTLHAAMLLNEEDGGHRQCILVTNNENQICENVTYERNRRVINGYPDPKGQMVMGLHSNNLRYYRTEFVSNERTRKNKLRLVRLAVDLLCIKEDVYQEQSSFFSIENINKEDFRYFEENGKKMLVIFNEDIIADIVEVIKEAQYEGQIKVYGFSPDNDLYSDEFLEVSDRVKLCALPSAIYNAYRNIIKRAQESEPYADDVQTVCTPSLPPQQPTLDL